MVSYKSRFEDIKAEFDNLKIEQKELIKRVEQLETFALKVTARILEDEKTA